MNRNDTYPTVRFGDVAREVTESTRTPLEDGFEYYVGLEHLDPESLKIRRWGLIEETATTFTRVFRAGQVLFGRRRAYQRKAALAEFDGICSGDIIVMEAKPDKLLPELLPFIMQTEGFYEHALSTSAGSLSPRTKWSALAKYEFPLPPLDEQRRIAEILWAVEDAINGYEYVLDELKITERTVLFQHMFRGLGFKDVQEIGGFIFPRTWDLAKLGNYLAAEAVWNGLYKPASAYGEGTPIIRIDSFQNGEEVNTHNLKRVTIAPLELETFSVQPRDILVNRVNSLSHLGKVAIVANLAERTVFESNMMCLRFEDNKGLIPEYALILLSSTVGRKQLLSRAKKAIAQSSINQNDVRDITFPIPSLQEQENILEIAYMFRSQISITSCHIASLNHLKKSLLQNLIG